MEIDVPERHANVLSKMCGLADQAELPERLVKEYWSLKRIADRTGDALEVYDFRALVHRLGYGKPLEQEANPSVANLYRAGKLARESGVIVQWRNTRRPGILKRVDGQGRCIVQMDGDPEERPFKTELVEVAKLVTA